MKELIRSGIRDSVFGIQDGLVSTLGALTGIAAGTQNTSFVLISGVVVVAVESISMAGGSYLSSRANREYLEHLLAEEKSQIETDPEGERGEIRQMYADRGFSQEEIALIERRLMSDPKLLLEDMAHKELGISPQGLEAPGANALFMGMAYVLGGAVPLGPYLLWPVSTAMPVSVATTAAALFAMGAAKGRLVRRSWWASGLETLGIGAAACALGFVLGRLVGGALKP